MPMLERVQMVAPDGRLCAVMVRDREKFGKQGYTVAEREYAEAQPVEKPAGESEGEASGLAVESRAFEQPDQATPVKRRKRKRAPRKRTT